MTPSPQTLGGGKNAVQSNPRYLLEFFQVMTQSNTHKDEPAEYPLIDTGFVQRVERYFAIPWGYGIAWVDMARNERVCMPMPFNLIAGWLFALYWWVMRCGDRYVVLNSHKHMVEIKHGNPGVVTLHQMSEFVPIGYTHRIWRVKY